MGCWNSDILPWSGTRPPAAAGLFELLRRQHEERLPCPLRHERRQLHLPGDLPLLRRQDQSTARTDQRRLHLWRLVHGCRRMHSGMEFLIRHPRRTDVVHKVDPVSTASATTATPVSTTAAGVQPTLTQVPATPTMTSSQNFSQQPPSQALMQPTPSPAATPQKIVGVSVSEFTTPPANSTSSASPEKVSKSTPTKAMSSSKKSKHGQTAQLH